MEWLTSHYYDLFINILYKMIETARREFKCKSLKYHDHVTKNIVTLFIFNARRPTVHMRPNLYE